MLLLNLDEGIDSCFGVPWLILSQPALAQRILCPLPLPLSFVLCPLLLSLSFFALFVTDYFLLGADGEAMDVPNLSAYVESAFVAQIFCGANPFCYTCNELVTMNSESDVERLSKKPRLGLRVPVCVHPGLRFCDHHGDWFDKDMSVRWVNLFDAYWLADWRADFPAVSRVCTSASTAMEVLEPLTISFPTSLQFISANYLFPGKKLGFLRECQLR